MTPLERAARDRIGALLDHWDRDPATAVFGSGDAATAFREDLRLVLAALDRHETIGGSVLETGRQVAGRAERFGPVPERVEITYSRVPRDLDPSDGSVWDLPRDEPEDEGD